ncbi:hypothetical protein O181_001901 [Austropuccinia psidii MF-1]|uniref:Uncharacterized protein n=1 Tax=Austropuccinia psidii MF-1 TaxID=1389203 RepID=A0A9Q3BC04_9BASI|nr:hypothetical protein [Austropuccinia psidii MF-1]
MNIHLTAKEFHIMWKRAGDKAEICIAEAKEYNKQRYYNTHKEPDFREGDQVLIWKNAVEVRLTEEFSRKHPVFPVSLVKPFHQTGEDKVPFRNKSHTPQEKVKVDNLPGPVKIP